MSASAPEVQEEVCNVARALLHTVGQIRSSDGLPAAHRLLLRAISMREIQASEPPCQNRYT